MSRKYPFLICDEIVKSRKTPFFVIPSRIVVRDDGQAGIQFFQFVTEFLDSGFHRSDDFLRNHQYVYREKKIYDGSGEVNILEDMDLEGKMEKLKNKRILLLYADKYYLSNRSILLGWIWLLII